jgi:transcriptional regulator with XRE-family HTH domain
MVDVALMAGISPETLRKIETGRVATPSFATVGAISSALGLSLDEVWASIEGRAAFSAPAGPGHISSRV